MTVTGTPNYIRPSKISLCGYRLSTLTAGVQLNGRGGHQVLHKSMALNVHIQHVMYPHSWNHLRKQKSNEIRWHILVLALWSLSTGARVDISHEGGKVTNQSVLLIYLAVSFPILPIPPRCRDLVEIS